MTNAKATTELTELIDGCCGDEEIEPTREALRMAISALEQQRWIPCSEMLPDKEGIYIITDNAGGMETVDIDDYMYMDDGGMAWLCSQNVTAWRELPEPYKGEQE